MEWLQVSGLKFMQPLGGPTASPWRSSYVGCFYISQLLIIMMTSSVNVAISPQNDLYESSYCNSDFLFLKSLYNSLDFAILEKSFPSP